MSEPNEPADNVDEEERAASGAESLDEDRLGVDPMEDGYDAPDEWGEATTAAQSRRGESLDERLDQEEPDLPS